MERRLAAILAADVAGFSRLASTAEEATLEELARLRTDVIDPTVARHGGRIFKSTGDGVLAVFPSIVEAVRCADAIQQGSAVVDRSPADGRRIVLRIGVHVGDVVVSGDDLLGDAVNVAARIEQLAPPGGICITAAAHDQVRDRLPQLAFRDGGEHALRNIPRPVRVWYLDAGSGSQVPAVEDSSTPLPPDRPALAVLPFTNLSGGEHDYFADGLTEEIITAVSRFKGLVVIASNASFSMRGREHDAKRVGDELGVPYLLRGSIRRAQERVRVNAQLVEAASGAQLWAERFDRSLSDVLDVQDEIAGRIVSAIAPQIREAEIARARRPGRTFTRSYDLAQRALALADEARRQSDIEGLRESLELAREATRIEPVSPRAFHAVAIASLRIADLSNFEPQATLRALNEAQAAAERLAEAEPANHAAYLLLGHVAIQSRRGAEARQLLQRSLELNPNDPQCAAMLSWAESNDGDAEAALAHAREALLRAPVGPDRRMILWMLALAHWVGGDPAAALPHAREAVAGRRSFVQRFGVLIACLVELGQLDEARELLQEAEAVAPGYVRTRIEGKTWFNRPELIERYASAFRKAAGRD
jgi:adenylate cyclase